MTIYNSKRYRLTIVGFATLTLLAILKNFCPGIDNQIVAMGVGLLTAYLGAETFRRSGDEKK